MVSLSDSTNVVFPQDSILVTCDTNVPLIFNAEGCPNAKVYWKYFDEKNRTQVDTFSENLAVEATTKLYVSCVDDQPFLPNMSGLNFDIMVQSTPAEPRLQLTNNSIVQCLTDGQLYINSGCDARYTAIWQDGSRSYQYQVAEDGVYSAQCVNLCGIGGETDIIVVNIADSFKNFKPNITATQTLICGSETATIFLDNPRFPVGFVDNSLFETKFNINSPNTPNDSVIIVSQPGEYFLSITSTTCGTIYSDTVTISNGGNPPLISASQSFICGNESTTITASNCQGIIRWSNGAKANSILVTQPYIYSATCENSCGISKKSNEIEIIADAKPAPPIVTADKTIICDRETATLTALGCNNTTIQWNTHPSQPCLASPVLL
jgi:hypothetical protein